MTKAEALKDFRENYLPNIPKGDKPARREGWNNYTDALCKGGLITGKQYETWTNPY